MIRKLLLTAIVITIFAGCAKMYEVQPSIQKLNDATKGRVVVTSYYVPQGSGEMLSLFVFGIPQNLEASIYDVTDGDIRYIGTIPIHYGHYEGYLLEYYPSIGKHVFMLTVPPFPKPLAWRHTDFIEVTVEKDKTTHLALPFSGFRKMPYFTPVDMPEEDFIGCSSIKGDYYQTRDGVNAYLASHNVPKEMEDFRHYCLKLAASSPIIATNDAVKKFNEGKEQVIQWYKEDVKIWQEKHENRPLFNLTHLYEKEEPTQANESEAK